MLKKWTEKRVSKEGGSFGVCDTDMSVYEVVDSGERPWANPGELVITEDVPHFTVEKGDLAVMRVKGGYTLRPLGDHGWLCYTRHQQHQTMGRVDHIARRVPKIEGEHIPPDIVARQLLSETLQKHDGGEGKSRKEG